MSRKTKRLTHLKSTVAMLSLSGSLLVTGVAEAGVIAISGTDADGVHSGQAGTADWAADWISYLQQGSSLDVLVLGDTSATGNVVSATGGVGVTTTTTLSGITLSTSNYSALYLTAGFGCCDLNDALLSGFESDISAFVADGGSVGLQNYIGEASLDFLIGTSGGANGSVFGYLGGAGGPAGYDDEVVTAEGVAAGFSATNYDPAFSWGHQGYAMSTFSALGFTSLIDAPIYGSDVSAVLSRTLVTDPAPVPEPGTLALMGLGLLGMTRLRRKAK